jgi:hypothetical protein
MGTMGTRMLTSGAGRTIVWTIAFVSPLIFALTFIILGVVTPGYDPVNYTISRLAIELYGWIYSLSLVLLATGFFYTGLIFKRVFGNRSAGSLWMSTFTICAALALLMILFPPDPLENARFSFRILSRSGAVHMGSVTAFIMISLPGIRLLSKSLRTERELAWLSVYTRRIGHSIWVLCILWIAFYLGSIFMEYRGLFQKAIAIITICWLTVLHLAVRKKFLNGR